jgi:hypothetical protein
MEAAKVELIATLHNTTSRAFQCNEHMENVAQSNGKKRG